MEVNNFTIFDEMAKCLDCNFRWRKMESYFGPVKRNIRAPFLKMPFLTFPTSDHAIHVAKRENKLRCLAIVHPALNISANLAMMFTDG